MRFDEDYKNFMDAHLKVRSGERLRRLQEGHNHAETMFLRQVWWPSFFHFNYLHPEYEVDDFKDGKRYLDFAYIRPTMKICFEIDGYGPHVKNVSRWQFSDSLERQNQLVIDGWTVIRFSFDQVKEHPRRCQQIIQQVIGRWLGEDQGLSSLSIFEKEIFRLAIRKGEAITPKEIESCLGISSKTVRKILNQLVDQKILIPNSGTRRVRTYRIRENNKHLLL